MRDRQDAIHDVSVIGLGAMGAGIARTFLDVGCRVSVWNRTRAKVDALVASGAIGCDGPGDALDANTHVVVCLSDYAVWRTVIEEHALADRLSRTCIIQLNTGTIDDVQAHASFLAENDARLADGAVMCYPDNLGTDDASLLMSGASEVLESCEPFLSMLDASWTNLGDDIKKPAISSRALMASRGRSWAS